MRKEIAMKRYALHATLFILPVIAEAQELSSLGELARRIAPEPRSLSNSAAEMTAGLDGGRFSRSYGKRGYWLPQLYRHLGANVYFLLPYDRDRIPVLFVHGAAGSPQDWSYLVEHLDRSRYQPWFFDYPTGAALDSMSDELFRSVLDVQARHHPEPLYLAAHSMGGLVVRSMLGKYRDRLPGVKLFISISTPWGGEDLARLAPPGLLNWQDMRPDGSFLTSLFVRELPSGMDYYLFFGYKGGRSLVRSRHDGRVTLKSELEMAAQAEARRVYGFNESHLSILKSPEVSAVFNDLLRTAEYAAHNRKENHHAPDSDSCDLRLPSRPGCRGAGA
jgi:pimeloyl-ACP methyl ester carboxylesterase